MDRYDNIKTEIKSGKGKVYTSNLIPNIAADDSDILIMTVDGDRLDLLANHYFGDATKWWLIAMTNNLTDIDLKCKPGTQLRIPTNTNRVTDLI
jgi:hypothetical protein